MQDDAEVAFRTQDLDARRRATGFRRIVAGRSAGPGGGDHEVARGRAGGARPVAACAAVAHAHDSGGFRLAWRALVICNRRQHEPERAVCFDRGAHDPRERHERGEVGRTGGRVPEREADPDAPRRKLRGRAEGERRDRRKRRRPSWRLSASNTANRPSARDRRSFFFPKSRACGARSREIARVAVYADDQLKATVAINDGGAYSAVSRRDAQTARKPRASEDERIGRHEPLPEPL